MLPWVAQCFLSAFTPEVTTDDVIIRNSPKCLAQLNVTFHASLSPAPRLNAWSGAAVVAQSFLSASTPVVTADDIVIGDLDFSPGPQRVLMALSVSVFIIIPGGRVRGSHQRHDAMHCLWTLTGSSLMLCYNNVAQLQAAVWLVFVSIPGEEAKGGHGGVSTPPLCIHPGLTFILPDCTAAASYGTLVLLSKRLLAVDSYYT